MKLCLLGLSKQTNYIVQIYFVRYRSCPSLQVEESRAVYNIDALCIAHGDLRSIYVL